VNHEGGASVTGWIDAILLPLFHVMLSIINLAQAFSPVDALSTGRSIPWSIVARAFAQIVLLLGGILVLLGIVTFTRRELATAATNA